MKNILLLTSLAFLAACEMNVGSTHKPAISTVEKSINTTRFANAKDPVCGMDTQNEYTDTVLVNGKTYGFCSATCKGEFSKAPDKYLVKEK
jgi:YHS domain-containing protein